MIWCGVNMDVTQARNRGVQRCENYTLCNRDHWQIFWINDGMQVVWVIPSNEYRRWYCGRNIHFSKSQNMSLSLIASFDDGFCLFRTWSFTLCKYDMDSKDNSGSRWRASGFSSLWFCFLWIYVSWFKFNTNLSDSREILTQEWMLSLFKDINLTSTPCLPCQ